MLELKNISFQVDDDGTPKDILKHINLTVNERLRILFPSMSNSRISAPSLLIYR